MRAVVFFFLFAAPVTATAVATNAVASSTANPIEKVIELISNLQAKVVGEGEEAQKLYEEFAEWCEDESKQKQFEIKTGEAEKEGLEATIAKASSDIEAADAAIGELSQGIATNEKDLKDATVIREKEHGDFVAEESDLTETIDMLGRAVGILEQEMSKHGAAAALLQQPQAQDGSTPIENLVTSLQALVQASSLSALDQQKLTALVQAHVTSGQTAADAAVEAEEEAAAGVGAPDPAAYKGHSHGIIQVLEDMLAKAEDQLADSRKREMNAQHNFELLEQSLKDEMENQQKNLDAQKKAKAEAAETKATAEGDLAVTVKDLEEDKAALASLHNDCMTKAQEFEAGTKSRNAELEALATAKKIIKEATEGGTEIVYSASAASFLQLGASTKVAAIGRVVDIVKDLARNTGSTALTQLAQRIRAVMRVSSSSGEDPFAKVKGLISEMIARLEKEANDEATKKAWCDHEMGKTKEQKEDLEGSIEELNAKIDKMTSDIARLKDEVKTLQQELAALAKSQAEMDALRAKEHEEYLSNKKELEEAIQGLQMALKVLRDYYASKDDDAHGKATGAASGIIGLLEVAESDFTKNLEDTETIEENAAAEYDRQTKENQITKVTKDQDVKYKTKEYKALEKALSAAKTDLQGYETEYAAVMEYWKSLQDQCIAKPVPYEERKRRREAEIAGLKEALSILEEVGGESLLQKATTKRHIFLGKQ